MAERQRQAEIPALRQAARLHRAAGKQAAADNLDPEEMPAQAQAVPAIRVALVVPAEWVEWAVEAWEEAQVPEQGAQAEVAEHQGQDFYPKSATTL